MSTRPSDEKETASGVRKPRGLPSLLLPLQLLCRLVVCSRLTGAACRMPRPPLGTSCDACASSGSAVPAHRGDLLMRPRFGRHLPAAALRGILTTLIDRLWYNLLEGRHRDILGDAASAGHGDLEAAFPRRDTSPWGRRREEN